MKPLPISLRVVFYKDRQHWIAHCLELDLVGHGRTRKGALRMMSKAIAVQVATSIKHNNPRNLFSPADGKVFAMFAAGEDVAMRIPGQRIKRKRLIQTEKYVVAVKVEKGKVYAAVENEQWM
jgi:predicted RNase H-like HicB family nuclease